MLANVDHLGATLDLRHPPDQVAPGHEAPEPGVAGRGTVVSEDEEAALRDLAAAIGVRVPARRLDERLRELPPVEVHPARPLRPAIAGKADEPFDVRPARAAVPQ